MSARLFGCCHAFALRGKITLMSRTQQSVYALYRLLPMQCSFAVHMYRTREMLTVVVYCQCLVRRRMFVSSAHKAVVDAPRLSQHKPPCSCRVDATHERVVPATPNDTRWTLFRSTDTLSSVNYSCRCRALTRSRAEQMMRLFRCRVRSLRVVNRRLWSPRSFNGAD